MQRQRLLLVPNDQGALSFTSIPRRKFLSSTTGNSRSLTNTTNQKGNDIISDDDDRIITTITKQALNAAAAIKSKVTLYGAFSTDDMMDIHDKNGDNEGIHFDHSDYNDYYPDFDQIDVLYSHIPIFTQTPPEPPKPTTTTTATTTKEKAKTKKATNSKASSSNKTPSKKRAKPSVTKSPLRQKMEDTIQTAFDDRMAQLNVYHDKCQTCPICQNEFLGGRYFMLHHLFHDYACTKDVPTEVLQKLIEQKEAQDGVKYDDIVLEPRGPHVKKKKKKKVLTKIESRKLHRKKDKKRTKEFRQWHKQRDERYGSDSDSGNNNYTTTDKWMNESRSCAGHSISMNEW